MIDKLIPNNEFEILCIMCKINSLFNEHSYRQKEFIKLLKTPVSKVIADNVIKVRSNDNNVSLIKFSPFYGETLQVLRKSGIIKE